MRILAVETATQACSAALFADGEISEELKIAPREHSKLILPMMDSLLNNHALKLSDLDCIAFGNGPGSFIGVRIATSVVQALAYGSNIPVIAISSLQSLAQQIFLQYSLETVVAAIDARMDQVYHGLFKLDEDNIMRLIGAEAVDDPIVIKSQYSSNIDYFIANDDISPTAGSVAMIASSEYKQNKILTAAQAMPSYIRNTVTRT